MIAFFDAHCHKHTSRLIYFLQEFTVCSGVVTRRICKSALIGKFGGCSLQKFSKSQIYQRIFLKDSLPVFRANITDSLVVFRNRSRCFSRSSGKICFNSRGCFYFTARRCLPHFDVRSKLREHNCRILQLI